MEFIIPFFSGLNKFLDRIIVNYLESGQVLGFFFDVGGARVNVFWQLQTLPG